METAQNAKNIKQTGQATHSSQARFRHFLFFAFCAVLLFSFSAIGQDATNTIPDPSSIILHPSSPELTGPPPVDFTNLIPLIGGALNKYPWIATILLVMGSLRIIFKPVFMVLENLTAGKSSNAAILKFESGPIYRWISYVLDFGASIKVPMITAPKP